MVDNSFINYYLKFKFSRLPADFLLYPAKNFAKGSAYYQILSYYFMSYDKTTLREFCFKLNKYIRNKKERGIPIASPTPNYLISKKDSLCRVKFPSSLTWFKLSWMNRKWL